MSRTGSQSISKPIPMTAGRGWPLRKTIVGWAVRTTASGAGRASAGRTRGDRPVGPHRARSARRGKSRAVACEWTELTIRFWRGCAAGWRCAGRREVGGGLLPDRTRRRPARSRNAVRLDGGSELSGDPKAARTLPPDGRQPRPAQLAGPARGRRGARSDTNLMRQLGGAQALHLKAEARTWYKLGHQREPARCRVAGSVVPAYSSHLKFHPVANSVRCIATQWGNGVIAFPKLLFNEICTEFKDASMSGFETEGDGLEKLIQTPAAPDSVEAAWPNTAAIGRTLVLASSLPGGASIAFNAGGSLPHPRKCRYGAET